jgi:hypothetical protein
MSRGIYLAIGTAIALPSRMRASNAFSWPVACGVVLCARLAAAQVPPAPPEPGPEAGPSIPIAPAVPVPERWYGWQTLLTDAGAITLTIALTASADEHDDAAVIGAFVIGASAFALGAPIVHVAHGHWGKAGISLALRLGLSLIGGAIGAGVGADSCSQYVYDHEGCAVGYGVLGLIAGATTALIVDAAGLAREPAPAPAPVPARNDPVFVFTPLRSGGGLTLVGRF